MKKQLLSILSALTGVFAGAVVMEKICSVEANKVSIMSDKHLALFLMMNQWVSVKQKEKNVADYLIEKNFKRIAIYGMSHVGKCLVEELKDSAITIVYGIDRNAEEIYTNIEMVSPDNRLEEVDAVIVTSIFFMDEIERDLSTKLSCPIISLEDILDEL